MCRFVRSFFCCIQKATGSVSLWCRPECNRTVLPAALREGSPAGGGASVDLQSPSQACSCRRKFGKAYGEKMKIIFDCPTLSHCLLPVCSELLNTVRLTLSELNPASHPHFME